MLQGKRLFAGPDGRLGAAGTLAAGLMAGFTEGLLVVTPMGEQLSPSRLITLSNYSTLPRLHNVSLLHWLALSRIGSLFLSPSLKFYR